MSANRIQLYRHFDHDGELLYVGISLSTIRRLAEHSRDSSWFEEIRNISIEPFENRESAMKAEKIAILEEKPKYNVQHKEAENHSEDTIIDVVFNVDMTHEEQQEAIDKFGGKKLAEYCEVSPPAVSYWKRSGIPSPWLRLLAFDFPQRFHYDQAV